MPLVPPVSPRVPALSTKSVVKSGRPKVLGRVVPVKRKRAPVQSFQPQLPEEVDMNIARLSSMVLFFNAHFFAEDEQDWL